MFIISTSAESPAVSDFSQPYWNLSEAQSDVLKWAKNSTTDTVYYVHQVSFKPVFKAASVKQVTSEVIS